MTLKDYYEEAKKKNISTSAWIAATTISICIIAIYFYGLYAGWNNIIAKVFNFPKITYIQTIGMAIWVFLVKILFNLGIRK